MEEEQRVKERIREEEFAAAAAASKSQENAVPNRPLATVTPRESNSTNREQERKERERQREKRRSERDNNDSNRKATVQLPNESSSGRGVKVHTVSPLYASYPVVMVERTNDRTEETAAPEASISPNPPAEEEKRTTEFSLGALEAMAALKQRSTVSPPPPEEVFTKPVEQEVTLDTVPLDLSEASVRTEVTSQPEICQDASQIEDPVRSLLDVRVERWKRKRQQSDAGEEEVDDDLDEEMCQDASESVVTLSVEQCLKTYPIPAGVSEEQHHFLHMFGLVTPQKRSGILAYLSIFFLQGVPH